MSRFRRAIHGITAGYVGLVGAALYSFASVPLALHYLSKERFALWALMVSIGGYLSLIDLGMSSSLARLLIDHKDDREGDTYGSLIQTGWAVLLVQGAIIWLAGFGLAPLLCNLLHIQADLQTEFIGLMRWQSATLALGFAMRIFGHLLQAHQRVDVVNYCQVTMLGFNFILLWFFFHRGQGVFSLVWASLLSTFGNAVVLSSVCWRLRLFPITGAWGGASSGYFKEIFNLGKDWFLVAVGTQLVMASQTIIIARTMGLQTAAAWSIGTRMFNLVCQVIWRISDVSSLAFAEMMVRGEKSLLLERYKSMVILTASLSGLAAIACALCNSLFVAVWTNQRISWPPLNDILLGAWMIVLALVHAHNGFALMTKKVGFMRYVYFVEGTVFVAGALGASKWAGMPAVILWSVLCSTAFSGAYGVWRISQYFNLSILEVGGRWLVPMGKVIIFFAPLALVVWLLSKPVNDFWVRLGVHAAFCGLFGTYFFLRYGLSNTFQLELIQRAPKGINPILRRVFAGASH